MKNFKFIILILSSMWLGMTMAVDFVAVPLVFQTLSSLQDAGRLGIAVFSRFNNIELILGFLILISSILVLFNGDKNRWGLVWLLLAISLSSLSIVYAFYLSPQIAFLGTEMHQFPLESEPYLKIYKEHQFFHHLYVKLDSAKMLILAVVIGSISFQIKKEGMQK